MADWKKIVATVAPGIATALGGPLAGIAVQAIGKAVLGREDASAADVEAAVLGASPDTLLALRKAEQDFAVRMAELDIDLERIHAGDRASARDREARTGDWTPRVLAAIVVIAWAVIQWHILTEVVPAEMRELAARALGTLDMALGMVLGYYFGSSAGSKAKTDALAKR